MRAVRLICVPFLTAVTLLPPHSRFVLLWGASTCLGLFPPYPVSGHTQRACAPAWGVPPLTTLGWGSPLLPLLHVVRDEADRLQADWRGAGNYLAGPSLWCSYTGPNSSTQCTVRRHCCIRMLFRTIPWWSRLIAGCNYNTAQPPCRTVCLTDNLP